MTKIDHELCRRLHEELLAGDPTASARLAEHVWESLVHTLHEKNPHIRRDTDFRSGRWTHSSMLFDAATEAWMSYVKAPTKYNPDKMKLFSYLVMSASGDLKNMLAKSKRRRAHEVAVGGPQELETILDGPDGNNLIEEDTDVAGSYQRTETIKKGGKRNGEV